MIREILASNSVVNVYTDSIKAFGTKIIKGHITLFIFILYKTIKFQLSSGLCPIEKPGVPVLRKEAITPTHLSALL